jgi:hypothetical protein
MTSSLCHPKMAMEWEGMLLHCPWADFVGLIVVGRSLVKGQYQAGRL